MDWKIRTADFKEYFLSREWMTDVYGSACSFRPLRRLGDDLERDVRGSATAKILKRSAGNGIFTKAVLNVKKTKVVTKK